MSTTTQNEPSRTDRRSPMGAAWRRPALGVAMFTVAASAALAGASSPVVNGLDVLAALAASAGVLLVAGGGPA